MAEYFVIICKDRPHSGALRQRLMPQHMEHLGAARDVKLVLGGATTGDADTEMNGACLVVQADSASAARAFADADPFARAGLFEEVYVRRWNWALGRPA
jgi:uncharacterized protein YciI